jgi:DNA integrity scanning protein DisA with diadenylate cyclase activity
MKPQKFNEQFAVMFDMAVRLANATGAEGLLVVLDGPTDWEELKAHSGGERIVVVADLDEEVAGAKEAGLDTILLDMEEAPVFERLTQALLEGVAQELLTPGAEVVAVYSSFEAGKIDSISYISLHEHLGRLTARDLRRLETQVPLDTLKLVVDLAIAIGREGREGKPVGTMFIVGDTRRVLAHSHPAGFDPVKGYSRSERDLRDPRVREAVKEIAPLDGAFIVSSTGIVEKACHLVEAAHANITLSKGLGSRHWAAAAISKVTQAIAVVVSESSGTVRILQDGEVILRVEPFRRAMIWKDFEYEPPPPAAPS